MLNPSSQISAPPPIIAVKHIFGINNDLKNHVHYIGENKVLYPAGHNLVILNTDDKSQIYINGIEGIKSFSATALSTTRKFLAVAEKADRPSVHIYDTSKLNATRKGIKKSITFQESNIREISALTFVPGYEDRLMVFLTSQPDINLYYYQWDKKKAMDSIKVMSNFEMTEVAVSSTDPNLITCLGPKAFRFYKFQENKLKLAYSQINGVPINSSQTYITHTWLNDGNLLVVTDQGELILADNNCEFIKIVDPSLVKNVNIECIIPSQKGFVVAGDNQTIYFYEQEEYNYYTRSKTVNLKNANPDAKEMKISSLSLVPTIENKLLCTTTNNLIFQTSLKSDLNLADEYTFEQVSEPFHYGTINGLDLCVRKPLIASCSSDCSIRIWNYETFTQECCKFFPEEALSISIHPSGFHIIASFSDRIKMMNIGIKNTLHEEANQNKEYSYIKGCRLVKFSNGGQYFAIVTGGAQNNQYVQVFNTYSGESPKYLILKGHSGKIRSVVWSKDDAYLLTCGTDGIVYLWRTADGTRVSDYNTRIPLSGACLMSDNRTIYAVGKDKYIRKVGEPIESFDARAMFGQVAVTNSNKVLFVGGADENNTSGFIRCYKMPVLSTSAGEFQAHDTQGVEFMKVTVDDQYLVTAGKDGIIVVFDIKDKEARGLKLRDGFTSHAQELIVTKKELEDMRNEKEALKGKKGDDNYSQQSELAEKEEIIKQLKERQRTLVESEQMKYANLQNTIKETEQKNIETIESRRKEYETEMVELESHHQEETVKKVSTIEKHKKEQEKRRDEYKRRISDMIEEHNREMKKIEEIFTSKIEEEVAQKDSILQDKMRVEREHEETIGQISEETKREKEDLEQKNASEIKNKTDEGLKSKGDVSIAKKKLEQLSRSEADLLENERDLQMKKDEHEKERQELKDFIEKQKNVIGQKDDSISEKEKRIYELKKRTQELEKFKAVLDFKIKELKKDIGPREEEIAKMKKKTNDMDSDLKKLSSINNTLGLVVDELDEKQKQMQLHIKSQRDQISKQRSKLKEIKDDVYMTVQNIQNEKELKQNVEDMKKKHAEHHVRKTEIDPDIYAEYVSQRKYLEKSVSMLKKHLQKDSEIHKQDNLRIMKDNVKLIKQINTLRKGIKDIKLSAKGTEDNAIHGMRARTAGPAFLKENRDENGLEMTIQEKKRLIDEQKQAMKQLQGKWQSLDDNVEVEEY